MDQLILVTLFAALTIFSYFGLRGTNSTIAQIETPQQPNSEVAEPGPSNGLYEPAPDPSGNVTYALACYINNVGNFSIGYPEGIWQKNETAGRVVFLAPLESSNDTFREGLILSFQNLASTNMKLEDYANSTLASLTQSLPAFQLIQFVPTTVTDNQATTTSNLSAFKLVYNWQHDQNQLRTMQIFTVIGDKVYTFVYTAEQDKYDNYLPNVREMINSLNYCSAPIG